MPFFGSSLILIFRPSVWTLISLTPLTFLLLIVVLTLMTPGGCQAGGSGLGLIASWARGEADGWLLSAIFSRAAFAAAYVSASDD